MGYQYKGNKPRAPPKPREPKRKTELSPCGTHAAYWRHHRKGETPCDECMRANRVYQQEYRKNKRKAA